jgi:outer membrane protein TolC
VKKSIIFIAIVSILSQRAFSLTWSEALDIAAKNSKEIQSAQKQVEASEWTYRKAYSSVLPQLSAGAGMSETTPDSTTEVTRSYSTSFSLSQTVFGGLDNLYNIQSAYADLEFQKASFNSTLATYYYDLRSAFIEVLTAQENVQLSRAILKQRKDNSNLIQLRYDSGKEDRGNLMTTKADQANSEHDYISARREHKLSLLKLSQLLQAEVTEVASPKGLAEAGEPDLDKLTKDNPTYVMKQKQFESSEIANKATLSGYLPSISLSASRRSSGEEWPPNEGSSSWSWSLSYSLFPGGSNIADSYIKGSQLDQAKADLDVAVKSLRYDMQNAYNGYLDALESLEVAKVQLAASKERAQITQAKYMNGLVNYDEWYRIENTYIQAQKTLLTSQKSAYVAEALWNKTYGGWVK